MIRHFRRPIVSIRMRVPVDFLSSFLISGTVLKTERLRHFQLIRLCTKGEFR